MDYKYDGSLETARPDLPPGLPLVLLTECLGWPERLL